LFIADKDTPILRVILQRGPGVLPRFFIGGIRFEIRAVHPNQDICIYHIQKDNFGIHLFVFGISTHGRCLPVSNLDFVQFIWSLLRFKNMY
jgi:hypothetical protein